VHAIDALSDILQVPPKTLRRRIVGWHTHDWQSDPFSLGAYSWVRAGGEGAQRLLAEPLEQTLFFAGEACNTEGHNGTVHGAMQTGVRAADEILKRLSD
jgi:monoamine oxidase